MRGGGEGEVTFEKTKKNKIENKLGGNTTTCVSEY